MKNVELINKSSDKAITKEVLSRIVDAVNAQAMQEYATIWSVTPPQVVLNKGGKPDPSLSPMVILDDPDQAGALGYHTVDPYGRPYSRIFWGPIKENGGNLTEGANSLSVTISHEHLEYAGDPWVTCWYDGPKNLQYAGELCDAVEGDCYEKDGISVSNFVTPEFFSQERGILYDYLGKLKAAFAMTPGGYQIVRTRAGRVYQIGAKLPSWKLAGKRHQGARYAKRGCGKPTLVETIIEVFRG